MAKMKGSSVSHKGPVLVTNNFFLISAISAASSMTAVGFNNNLSFQVHVLASLDIPALLSSIDTSVCQFLQYISFLSFLSPSTSAISMLPPAPPIFLLSAISASSFTLLQSTSAGTNLLLQSSYKCNHIIIEFFPSDIGTLLTVSSNSR